MAANSSGKRSMSETISPGDPSGTSPASYGTMGSTPRFSIQSADEDPTASTQTSRSGTDGHLEDKQKHGGENGNFQRESHSGSGLLQYHETLNLEPNGEAAQPGTTDQDVQTQNKDTSNCSWPVYLLYLLFYSLGLLVLLWAIGNVALSILINSTTQLSLKAETGVMKYIKIVNNDNVIDYETYWTISIVSLTLLSTLSFALARVHFKEWNPWAPNTHDKGVQDPFDSLERCELHQSTTPWNVSRISTESNETGKLTFWWSNVLSAVTFLATALSFGTILIGCYCLVLGLHLYHDAQHPQINPTNQTHTGSPKLGWSQYKDLLLWIIVTGLASGLFLPTASFTGYVLTKGRITMTDAFFVFGFLKIRNILVHHNETDYPSVVWCFADAFYVTKRWKRWACAIALWYMLWFFTSIFIAEFGVMGMYQYTIRQGPNCNDTNVWDCFTLSKSASHYGHMTPIVSHNCSLVQARDPIICMRVGDITMAAEDGFAKALGISAAVVTTYLFVLRVFINLIARVCNSDKTRKRFGIGLCCVIAGLLLVCFVAMVVIDYRQFFLSYATQRYRVINLAVLGASVGAILLLSTYKTEILREQPVLQEATLKDTTSKVKCVAVVVVGFLSYFIPIVLVVLDQQYTT